MDSFIQATSKQRLISNKFAQKKELLISEKLFRKKTEK